MADTDRPTLGPFISLTCFQYLQSGTEDVAGRAPLVAAGRQRGYDLIEGLGLLGSMQDGAQICDRLDAVLGRHGTRLCLVHSVISRPGGGYEVRISEGACTAGQTARDPLCSYTLGVFIGAIHALTGTPMKGVEVACQAGGAPVCVYQVDPL